MDAGRKVGLPNADDGMAAGAGYKVLPTSAPFQAVGVCARGALKSSLQRHLVSGFHFRPRIPEGSSANFKQGHAPGPGMCLRLHLTWKLQGARSREYVLARLGYA
jgi:hypothetical protein